MNTWLRISAIAGAGILFIHAARKRSPTNLLLFGMAAAMLGVAIHGGGRSLARDAEDEEDIVDVASELSFPASDPPAY